MVDPAVSSERKSFRYLDVITAFFVAVLLISNTVSVKLVHFWIFTYDGGTILFPLSYIFGDILTEVYGFSRSRKVIWLGFACTLLMANVYILVGRIPAAQGWPFQQDYVNILGLVPRIVIASLIAYFAGEFSNSYTLAKMKIWTRGRWLWSRTIGSTIVGEFVDTLLFVSIAFLGATGYPTRVLVAVLVSNYIFKVGVEVLFTPLTYAIVGFLKHREQEDFYDYHTDFNPFHGGGDMTHSSSNGIVSQAEPNLHRPNLVTFACILAFATAQLLIFKVEGQELVPATTLYLVFNALLILLATVGLWRMKRWALTLAAALFLANQGILFLARAWHPWTLASVLPVATALWCSRRMG
ncbi:MAG TPA: queuosine precursor transporter [bacterium]|nr:queuosine precursor transporter [bacterium]